MKQAWLHLTQDAEPSWEIKKMTATHTKSDKITAKRNGLRNRYSRWIEETKNNKMNGKGSRSEPEERINKKRG